MRDRKKEIMEATYTAVVDHGYEDLSVQKIAEEMGCGKSLIYYHFEDRRELVLGFLDDLAEEMESELADLEERPPEKRLEELIKMLFDPETEPSEDFHAALREMRAASISDGGLRDRLVEIDRRLKEFITEALEDAGVSEARSEADIVLSILDGALSRKICGCEVDIEPVREFVRTRL